MNNSTNGLENSPGKTAVDNLLNNDEEEHFCSGIIFPDMNDLNLMKPLS